MGFDLKVSKAPRSARYAFLAFIFITVIVLLMNSRISSDFWRDEQANKEIFTVNSDATNVNSVLMKEIAAEFMTDYEETSATDMKQDASTLQLLSKASTDCFEKYGLRTEVDVSFENQELDMKKMLSFFKMLSAFNKLMVSLDIEIAVIEPSVLYCMLETKDKDMLSKRNFNITDFKGSNSILTYGVIADDVTKLQQEDNIRKFRSLGFQSYFLQESSFSWMEEYDSGKYTSHVFYSYFMWTIHMVVLHKRSNYIWHAKMNSNDELNTPHKKDLLFVNRDSAYENFTFVNQGKKWPDLPNLYTPSNPQYFLFQIPSSRFLECNLTRAVHVTSSTESPTNESNSKLKNFKDRTLVALKELKEFFTPLFMHFWIFSGTMLGWYRQCDIIPYTTDVDFGAWASEIEDLEFLLKHFQQNKKLKIRERMGLLEEALEFNLNSNGLRVDVFFMYKLNNGSWASGHRPSRGYYFRYYYPHFTLCSAELLEEKVQVPCETEDVIVTEYGPNWMTPISSWYYESSIYNRGPNIHWDEKRKQKVFEEY